MESRWIVVIFCMVLLGVAGAHGKRVYVQLL
jgi:hypothetical protein